MNRKVDCNLTRLGTNINHKLESFYHWNTLNFSIMPIFVSQSEVYYKVDRLNNRIIIEGYIFTEIEFNKHGSLVTFKLLIACFIFKSSSFNNLNIAGIADFLYLSVFICLI